MWASWKIGFTSPDFPVQQIWRLHVDSSDFYVSQTVKMSVTRFRRGSLQFRFQTNKQTCITDRENVRDQISTWQSPVPISMYHRPWKCPWPDFDVARLQQNPNTPWNTLHAFPRQPRTWLGQVKIVPEITSTIDWKIMIHEFQPHPGGYVLVVPSTFSPSYKKLVESFYKVVTSDITAGLCDIIPPVIYLFVSGLAIYLVCFLCFNGPMMGNHGRLPIRFRAPVILYPIHAPVTNRLYICGKNKQERNQPAFPMFSINGHGFSAIQYKTAHDDTQASNGKILWERIAAEYNSSKIQAHKTSLINVRKVFTFTSCF